MGLPSITREALLAAATPRGGLLLVRSLFEFGTGPRVGLLDVERTKPRLLADGLGAPGLDLEEVSARWGSRARLGLWDALAATDWTVAWTDRGPFELHRPNGKGFAQVDAELHRTGGGLSLVGDPTLAFTPARVEAYVDPEWVHRGVKAHTATGLEVVLHATSDIEWMADPTYDALDLAMDAAWASMLAQSLGAALGVPIDDGIR